MARIKQEKIFLKDGTTFLKIVLYSKKRFHIILPEQVCADLCLEDDNTIVSGDTESVAEKLFKDRLMEWETQSTNETKVILFEANFHGALAKKSFKHRWEKGYTPSYQQSGISTDQTLWEFNERELGFGTHIGMTLQWAVYTKKTFKENSTYTFVTGRPFDSPGQREYVEIEYTPDREKLLLELDEAFANMIAKVYKFLGALTPEKLTLFMESKLNLLS